MKARIGRAATLSAATLVLVPAALVPAAAQEPPPATPTSSATPTEAMRGAPGIGDPYFPKSGNGGYDVSHYSVDLAYANGGRVEATVALTARTTQALSAYDLDFSGPAVDRVTVDGRPAAFQRSGQELTITPETPLAGDAAFTTVVHYAGTPHGMRNTDLGGYGWLRSRDGALVLAEPDGAQTWLPGNDHPRDKATYDFRITVPRGLRAVSNGLPDPPVRHGATTTYSWHERSPMATYLATVAIGRFRMLRGTAVGVPVITAVDPTYAKYAKQVHKTTIRALRWEARMFGRYPFASAGAIVDDPKVGYALETQERPAYAGFAPGEDFIVHELAHQWFGDSVGLTMWSDIWLNEGLATYAEWLWAEHAHHRPANKQFRFYYEQPAKSAIFSPPPGRPGVRGLFSYSVYIRGAMTIQALRTRVGDKIFFRTLRRWAAEHRAGTATTAQFIDLVKWEASGKVSNRRIERLFRAWLYHKGKPVSW